jgi:hypothetical protein
VTSISQRMSCANPAGRLGAEFFGRPPHEQFFLDRRRIFRRDAFLIAHVPSIAAQLSVLPLSRSHSRHALANAIFASSNVAVYPCDGSRGATTAPVIVHIQGRSVGALLLRKMRPMARVLSHTS